MANRDTAVSGARKWLVVCTLLALAVRIGYACLFWTPVLKENNGSTVKKIAATAYGWSAGLGYRTALPGTPAAQRLNELRVKGESWQRITAADTADFPQEGSQPETMYPPGVAMLGGIAYRLFGIPIWLTWQVAGVLADTLVVPLVYGMVMLGLGRTRVARAAMLSYTLFPPAWFNAVSMYTTALVPLFAALACFALMLAVKSGGRRRLVMLLAAGLAVALCGYFRSDYLLLGVSFFPALWLTQRNFWLALWQTALVQLTALVLLFPWAYRNHEISQRWVFGGSNTGGTLVTGLGAYPNPWGFGPRDQDRWREAADAGLTDPFDFDSDLHFQKVFRQAIAEHPGAYLRIVLSRLGETLAEPLDSGLAPPADAPHGSEIRSRGAANLLAAAKAHWARGLAALVVLASNVGWAILAWREWRKNPLIFLLLMVAAYASISHVFTFLLPNFLMPGVFAQIIGLGYLLTRGWRASAANGPAADQPPTAPA